MKITLKSKVKKPLRVVFENFDSNLFKYLLPPGAKLLRFDGSKKGDFVNLRLPLAGEWLSEITENGESEEECYFIDEGRKIPWPLKKWKHKHIISDFKGITIITDEMNFSTGNSLFDVLVYPFLYLAFYPRTYQYQKYFKGLH